ncbi:hypothetical protein ACFFGF_04945 [Asaia lannensis]|uniref:Phage protein n=1 Tax=Asaia lannensis NBRC 102526 TaxID=1307926 RepID=A0ABT1CIE5_9PROT|nr:hypothetical protein [Asaia lannensis]MCO6160640.1 hypothetical protein [Asaia lannensis NBRC 102526]GBR02131.1 hypothetical protein AA102526_2727 [Asaia lannensis NBRC 102526]
MTHEQKPESAEFLRNARAMQAKVKQRLAGRAEFRTREAQIDSLTFHLHEATCDVCWSVARTMAEGFILEAEAQGAAERRREDAEGTEPFAWGVTLDIEMGYPFLAHKTPISPIPARNVPLYVRPANVTALEARVKELEGALSYLKDEALRFADMYPQSSDMRNTFGVFASKIAARAAALRVGGEHD